LEGKNAGREGSPTIWKPIDWKKPLTSYKGGGNTWFGKKGETRPKKEESANSSYGRRCDKKKKSQQQQYEKKGKGVFSSGGGRTNGFKKKKEEILKHTLPPAAVQTVEPGRNERKDALGRSAVHEKKNTGTYLGRISLPLKGGGGPPVVSIGGKNCRKKRRRARLCTSHLLFLPKKTYLSPWGGGEKQRPTNCTLIQAVVRQLEGGRRPYPNISKRFYNKGKEPGLGFANPGVVQFPGKKRQSWRFFEMKKAGPGGKKEGKKRERQKLSILR